MSYSKLYKIYSEVDFLLKQLVINEEDKKEDLDYLQEQIKQLTLGLKEMPDKNQNGYFKIHKLNLQGKKGPVTREYVNSKDAVCAVVFDTIKNKYIFAKQFRPGPKMVILELCAGMLDHAGEGEMQTAE